MRKVILFFVLSFIVVSCGSNLTYEEQISQYNELISTAASLNEIKEYNQAILSSTQAIKITDTLSPAYIQRGEAHLRLNNLDDAKDDFSAAIKIDGEKSDAYKGRAIVNFSKDEKKEFLKDINIYIKHHKKDIAAYSLRADYYAEVGDYKKAILDYSICLNYEPENSSFYLKRGNVYAINGQNDQSIRDYENYTRLNPDKNNDEIIYKRAILNMKGQNFQKAINDFSLISESFGKVEIFDLKGDCFFNLYNYDEAIENYSCYLAKDSNNYGVIDKRGNAYLEINDLKNANSDFIKSASLKWKTKGFFYIYGWYILFIIAYFLIGIVLFVTIKEEYDNKKVRKSYFYYFITGIFGGHYLYTNSYLRYLLHTTLIFTLFFLNNYDIRSFYSHSDLLMLGVLSSTYSLYIIYTLLFLLVTDLILLPYFVFSHNHGLRNSINNKLSKQRETEINKLEKLMNRQNTNFKTLRS